jgi:hypothetical protein
MQRPLFTAIALFAASETSFSDEQTFRSALLSLPPKYLADIPLSNREKFMKEVGSDSRRLRAAGGWLHWYSDGGDVGGTSMAWAKELPRPGKTPLVFVHMAKPFADGRNPGGDQTFVVQRAGDGWTDVTKQVMPPDVDLSMHFRTRQKDTVIEVALWKQINRSDGRGKAWIFGSRVADLHWSGERFVARKPESEVLTKN